MELRFIVDNNVGKLAKWLRVMGYDALFFEGEDDTMIRRALAEDRIVLTKDRQIMKRRVVTKGKLKALLLLEDDPWKQLQRVVRQLKLDYKKRAFSLCLECNSPLVSQKKEEVKDLVPPFVFQTQSQFMQCPHCGRIYWRGTHWQAMSQELEALLKEEVG